MGTKLGQEPAFAAHAMLSEKEDICQEGMSKRFYAACAAMQGMLANNHWVQSGNTANDFDEYRNYIVSASYELADQLLKEEYK